MGRLLTITATGQAKTGIRKRTLSRDAVRVGPVSVQLLVIVVGTLLGLFYLVQSNRVSTQNLQLKSIEAKKAQIVEENERLSVEAARLQSIQQIKKSAAETKAKTTAAAEESAAVAAADKAAQSSTAKSTAGERTVSKKPATTSTD